MFDPRVGAPGILKHLPATRITVGSQECCTPLETERHTSSPYDVLPHEGRGYLAPYPVGLRTLTEGPLMWCNISVDLR